MYAAYKHTHRHAYMCRHTHGFPQGYEIEAKKKENYGYMYQT